MMIEFSIDHDELELENMELRINHEYSQLFEHMIKPLLDVEAAVISTLSVDVLQNTYGRFVVDQSTMNFMSC